MFAAHFRDMVESRGGSRWWNTNFGENAHIAAAKTTYRAGNKQAATLQLTMAKNFERRDVLHQKAVELNVHQHKASRIAYATPAGLVRVSQSPTSAVVRGVTTD